MIILDFQVDEESVARDLRASPETANAAAIEQTYFVMPVRFAIGDTELLALPSVYESWRPQPIIGFPTHVLGTILGSKPGETAYCHIADGGRLAFQRAELTIRVSSTLLIGRAEIVETTELTRTATTFRNRVRDLVLQRVPTMASHPWWVQWFPNG
jgi:hypothetical protein